MCSLDFSTIQCCSLKEKKKVDKSWEVLLLRHSFLWHSTPTVKLSCLCCALLVMSDSLWPHGLWPTRLLCPWYFPGKKTRVGYHFLLQGNLPNPGIKPTSLASPTLAGEVFTTSATWKAQKWAWSLEPLIKSITRPLHMLRTWFFYKIRFTIPSYHTTETWKDDNHHVLKAYSSNLLKCSVYSFNHS